MSYISIFRGISIILDRYIVIERNEDKLVVQTESGRKLVVIPFILFSLMFQKYILFSVLLLLFLWWTYEKILIFDKLQENIIIEKRILIFIYRRNLLKMESINNLYIKKKSIGEADTYYLLLEGTDGNKYNLASHGECYPLEKIAQDISNYIPMSDRFKDNLICQNGKSIK